MADNVSTLKGQDRIALLNLNARKSLEKMGRGDWYNIIQQSSDNTSGAVQPYEIYLTISRESSFNPKAQSKISSAGGLGQFINDTAKAYGIQNKYDPNESIMAIGRYLGDLKNQIKDSNPLAAQQAYMLGSGGYNKMMRGSKDVKGINDIGGLINKWNNDLRALGGGDLTVAEQIAKTRTPEDLQGLMSEAPQSQRGSIVSNFNRQSKQQQRPKATPVEQSRSKLAGSELGGLGSLDNLGGLGSLGQL